MPSSYPHCWKYIIKQNSRLAFLIYERKSLLQNPPYTISLSTPLMTMVSSKWLMSRQETQIHLILSWKTSILAFHTPLSYKNYRTMMLCLPRSIHRQQQTSRSLDTSHSIESYETWTRQNIQLSQTWQSLDAMLRSCGQFLKQTITEAWINIHHIILPRWKTVYLGHVGYHQESAAWYIRETDYTNGKRCLQTPHTAGKFKDVQSGKSRENFRGPTGSMLNL